MKSARRIKKHKTEKKEDLPDIMINPPTNLPQRRITVKDITPEELLFAYEWANNPTEPKKALLAAGITTPRDSMTIVRDLEHEYTTNHRVLQAYQEALFHRIESLQITNNKIDSHLSVIAFTDRGLCKDEYGGTIPIHKMPWEIRQCVQEFEERMYYPPKGTPYKKTRVKFYSTVEALRTLRSNKKEDHERILGMAKVIGGENGTININNIINSGNNFGTYYNNEQKNTIDLGKLNNEELRVFLKAMNREIPDEIQKLESTVQEIIDIEMSELSEEQLEASIL